MNYKNAQEIIQWMQDHIQDDPDKIKLLMTPDNEYCILVVLQEDRIIIIDGAKVYSKGWNSSRYKEVEM